MKTECYNQEKATILNSLSTISFLMEKVPSTDTVTYFKYTVEYMYNRIQLGVLDEELGVVFLEDEDDKS